MDEAVGQTDSSCVGGNLSCRVVVGLAIQFKQQFGVESLERTLSQAFPDGELTLDYLEDGNNWVSFELAQRMIDALCEASGDPDFARKAGQLTASRQAIGFVYRLLQALGTPKSCYKKVIEMGSVYNRAGKFRMVELSSSHAVIAYRSSLAEPNLRFSEYRMGQFESLPVIWGLPPAQCWKRSCQVTGGAPESVYEFRWSRTSPRLPLILGGLLGGSGTALLVSHWAPTIPWWATAVLGVLLGSLLPALYQHRQQVRELRARLYEQSEDLIKAWQDLQDRFDEIQNLNVSLEQRVEQRTAELASANERLKELDQLKSHFFANISHELRTPLTLTLGPIEALLTQIKDAAHRDQLQMVRENQLRLQRLIEELLELAQLEAGKVKVCFRPTDLAELLERLVSTVRGAMECRGIQLEVSLPAGPLEVYIDQEKIERVILNLLNNAFKFTSPGGKISVRLELAQDATILAVQDTGIGIPKEKLTTIFDRFVQAEGSEVRTYGGTGIGLSLVKEYMDLHRGTVMVESEPGRGSTFTLRFSTGKQHLPREHIAEAQPAGQLEMRLGRYQLEFQLEHTAHAAQTDDDDLTIGPEGQRRPRFAGSEDGLLENPRILVVEDTPSMRHYLRGLLCQEYEVIMARDGAAGMEKARTVKPDIILSDVMMPKMSGRELCQKIKSDPGALGRTPVVLLTARAEEQTKLESLAHGADDYLLKPFSADELRLRLRNLLVKHRQREALRVAHHQLRSQKVSIDGDLKAARSFQRSLLPKLSLPSPLAGHVEFHPAAPVGGDFYHVLPMAPDRTRLLLADMVDHGVKSALRTIAAWAEYTILDHQHCTPAQVLQRLSQVAATKYQDLSGSFACLDLQVIERDCVQIRYAQAGEAPMTKITPRGWEDVEAAEGFIVGIMPSVHYSDRELTLRRGERLFLYTDGLRDQRDGGVSSFRDQHWDRVWRAAQQKPSIREACQGIIADFHEFRGAQPQLDDVTLLGLELGALPVDKEQA